MGERERRGKGKQEGKLVQNRGSGDCLGKENMKETRKKGERERDRGRKI